MKFNILGGAHPMNILPLHKRNVVLSGKKKPRVLFIPTALRDHEGYIRLIDDVYGKKFGCTVDVLYLLGKKPNMRAVARQILAADILYVGGGNTLMMMNRWRYLGVDMLLKKAAKAGAVSSGASAGGICWFDSGHSDSMSFYHPKKWEYINVSGLGLIKGIHCPHFDSDTLGKKRKDDFGRFMEKRSGVGIALDNHTALEIVGDDYTLRCKKGSSGYQVQKWDGIVVMKKLRPAGLVADLYV